MALAMLARRELRRPPPDETLLARVAAGDEAALGALYDRHARAVYSFALASLGRLSEAEDVTEAAFTALWRDAPRLTGRRPQSRITEVWLMAAAHRAIEERLAGADSS
jgi:RNA polymerase sigma-70 factor, ECF subfamily